MQTILRTTRWLLDGAALCYCIGVVVLALLWTTRIWQAEWLELANVFALWLFTPLLILTPLAMFVRSAGLRAATAITLVTFGVLFSSQLTPRFSPAETDNPFRVVTFNALYDNKRIDSAVAAIRAQGADVVALQELSSLMAEAIEQQLRDEFPYQHLQPAAFDTGLGIISRYPLAPQPRVEGFRGQQAIVSVNGKAVTLINVHLKAPSVEIDRRQDFPELPLIRDYDTSQRQRQARALLRVIDATDGPLIVLGDFNTGDREPLYREFDTRLHDAYRETAWGFGYTFPNDNQRFAGISAPFQLVRIDYVWSRGGVTPMAARAECDSGGSDHCMVVADVRLDG